MHLTDEREIFVLLKKGDEKAFESLFHKYYGLLCAYAARVIDDHDAAEELVQDFFVKLWEKREQLSVEISVKNYLFRSVKNHCINYIQHNKIKLKYARLAVEETETSLNEEFDFPEPDIFEKIEICINELPEKRREIFRLSRRDGLKYHQIADKLQISVKTVETQMSLAFKSLREQFRHIKFFFTIFL